MVGSSGNLDPQAQSPRDAGYRIPRRSSRDEPPRSNDERGDDRATPRGGDRDGDRGHSSRDDPRGGGRDERGDDRDRAPPPRSSYSDQLEQKYRDSSRTDDRDRGERGGDRYSSRDDRGDRGGERLSARDEHRDSPRGGDRDADRSRRSDRGDRVDDRDREPSSRKRSRSRSRDRSRRSSGEKREKREKKDKAPKKKSRFEEGVQLTPEQMAIFMGRPLATSQVVVDPNTKTQRELFVGNTPPGTNEAHLLSFLNEAFKQVKLNNAATPGEAIIHARVSDKFAFVELRSIEEVPTPPPIYYCNSAEPTHLNLPTRQPSQADRCLSLNGIPYMGATLRVGRPSKYSGPEVQSRSWQELTGGVALGDTSTADPSTKVGLEVAQGPYLP